MFEIAVPAEAESLSVFDMALQHLVRLRFCDSDFVTAAGFLRRELPLDEGLSEFLDPGLATAQIRESGVSSQPLPRRRSAAAPAGGRRRRPPRRGPRSRGNVAASCRACHTMSYPIVSDRAQAKLRYYGSIT